jgi:integrase
MSAFLGTLVAEGKLERNPCNGLKMLPIVTRRPRTISPLEVERIRLELPTLRDVVLVGAMAYAGLRAGEALALSVDSITDNVIVVDRNWTYGELKLTKTERRRTVEVVPGCAMTCACICLGRLSRTRCVSQRDRRLRRPPQLAQARVLPGLPARSGQGDPV